MSEARYVLADKASNLVIPNMSPVGISGDMIVDKATWACWGRERAIHAFGGGLHLFPAGITSPARTWCPNSEICFMANDIILNRAKVFEEMVKLRGSLGSTVGQSQVANI